MSKFKEVVDYFNSENRNAYFLTRDFSKRFGGTLNSYSTYKCYLRSAGYIRKVDTGLYQKVKNIPENITVSKLLNEAYPKEPRYFGRAPFMAPIKLTPALIEIFNTKRMEMPRTQIVKNLWVYIKKHNLQDPKNKRIIICDAKLRKVMGKSSISMFEMVKALSNHLGFK